MAARHRLRDIRVRKICLVKRPAIERGVVLFKARDARAVQDAGDQLLAGLRAMSEAERRELGRALRLSKGGGRCGDDATEWLSLWRKETTGQK
jgi:hypothetical protein